MKATYFAAAAAVALAGMSGTAHAAFISDNGALTSELAAGPLPDDTTGVFTANRVGSKLDEAPKYRSPWENEVETVTSEESFHSLGEDDNEAKAKYNISGSSLSFVWGSPDSFNSVEFLDSLGTVLDTVTGTDIPTSAIRYFDTGNTALLQRGYAYVTISDIGGNDASYSAVQLKTTGNSFEYAAVPLPAAAWLMIGGLGAVSAYARRARKAAPSA